MRSMLCGRILQKMRQKEHFIVFSAIVRLQFMIIKKVGLIYDPYVREVPVREDICPGPSALSGRVAGTFPRRLYLPNVSTGSPFAAGWTVSEPPIIGSGWVPNRGLRHSRQAL